MIFKLFSYTPIELKDRGGIPYVVDIQKATLQNTNFRTALWTGKYFQLTLMSIPVGGEIGLEAHKGTDQFLRIESGYGLVMMGESKDDLDYQVKVSSGDAVFIPADTYHNLKNIGKTPIKLYSIYAPPEHPKGTVHKTKQEADEAENH